MTEWVSAAEIVELYVVSEATLLEYSARGNLPCSRGRRDGAAEEGEHAGHDAVYFDLAHVARIFRPRSAVGAAQAPAVLGRIALGQKLVRVPPALR